MERFRYINKLALPDSLQNDNGKFAVNIWLMTRSQKQSLIDFDEQHLATLYTNDICKLGNTDSVIEDIFKYVDGIDKPSKLSYWIANFSIPIVKEMCDRWLTNRTFLSMPSLDVNEKRLCTASGVEPPLAIVHYFNHLNPQFAGYYFEQALALAIDCKSEDVSIDEIEPTHTGENDALPIREEDKRLLNHLLLQLSTGADERRPVQLLRKAIVQSLSNKVLITSYSAIYKFMDALRDDLIVNAVEEYIDALTNTAYVQRLRKLTPRLHSVDLAGTIGSHFLHGEADFIVGNIVIDAKACKQIKTDCWFAQLNLYRQLYKDIDLRHMEIVSLMNNRIYYSSLQ